MKKLLLSLLVPSLFFTGWAASAQCLSLTCAPDKTVECGTNWVFDPPVVTNVPGCSCGTNYTLTIISTTTNSTAGSPCNQKAEQVWQLIDCGGSLVTCTQAVTVVDTTPPVVNCAPDMTVTCGSSWVFTPPTAFDACCGTNVFMFVANTQTNANPSGCGVVADQFWVIRDCCGNITNCDQHVTILPGPPVLLCTNMTVACGGPLPVPPLKPAVLSPCCSAVQVVLLGSSTNPGCSGGISLFWKAVDCCGSSTTCTQLISFVPSPPTLLCSTAAGTVVECGNPIPTNPPPFIDLCCTNLAFTLLSSSTNLLGGPGCPKAISQVWQASNCCGGGVSVCTQVVTVVDTTPPSLTCASNKTVQCGSGWVFDPPTASDICCGTNLTYAFTTNKYASPLICQTIYEGIWRVMDCCSNFNVCTQLVTEVDTVPPVVTCASNKTVQCGTTWTFDPPISAFDVCCGTNLTYQLLAPIVVSSTPCQTVWDGVWQVGDCCANYTTCTQRVTEVDTIGPALACNNKTVQCGSTWTFDPPSATDCCPIASLTYQLLSTNVVGTPTVCNTLWAGVWRVTDCCSNSSVCTQLVSVVDTQPPTLVCPTNITVAAGTPWNFGQPTASDACCGTNVTIAVQSTVTNGTCSPITITRTWRATDCCSNSSAPCSQTVTLLCGPAPPNDLCANAIPVFAGSPAYCGTTVCATPSTGIATCAGSAASPDVWFKYVPVCTGPVTIDTCGVCPGSGTFNTVLSAYTGTCNALTMIACNNNAGGTCGVQSRITFVGTAGFPYYLRVAGPLCASGPFRLNITAPTSPPPNDLCSNAIQVFAGSPAACGTTMCATPSTGIPVGCGSSINSPDVWYYWTPLCNGTATIDTCGLCPGQFATFNTVLTIYSGSCGALWPVACNDNATGCSPQSSITFTPTPGVKYYIRVAGFDTTPTGPFRLNISQTLSPPFNDACANAITLLPSGVSMFNTCGATLDGPNTNGCVFSDDVWFRYIAPCSGLVSVDTCGTPFNTVAAVYTGPCTSLNLVACNDDATTGPCNGSQQSYLTFTATAGTVYTIRVGGIGGAQGWGILRVQGPYPTANTCPPASGPCFWRLFQVQGLANNTSWSWSIRSPCCANVVVTNAPGLPTGSSANQLAAAFATSINNACPGGGFQAFSFNFGSPWQGLLLVCVPSCTNTPSPWVFSIGPAGTPAQNQCVVANIFTPCCPLIPLPTTGPCSFNPPLVELPYANADLNHNGKDDALDIMDGTSADLNMNGIPDEAEACQGPQVTTEPESQVVQLGTDVTLAVSAIGTAPLSYQWTLNGAPLAGQVSSQLTLNNIQAAQLGDYGVIVANACGTNEVGPFTLSADTPEAPVQPVIRAMTYVNGIFQLTFTTESGQNYVVEYKNRLSDTSWTQLTTVNGDGQDHTVMDTPPLPSARFYHLRAVTP